GTAVHVVITEDVNDHDDGVARRVPMVIERPDGGYMPALALALAAATIDSTPRGLIVVQPRGVQLGSVAVPTTTHHDMIVSFGARPTVISAADVLSGAARARLAGKAVLIGATDPTLGD